MSPVIITESCYGKPVGVTLNRNAEILLNQAEVLISVGCARDLEAMINFLTLVDTELPTFLPIFNFYSDRKGLMQCGMVSDERPAWRGSFYIGDLGNVRLALREDILSGKALQIDQPAIHSLDSTMQSVDS